MLRPLDNKLVTVDKLKPRAIDQVLSTGSYAASHALPLERSNLIGQLGTALTAKILQRNGTVGSAMKKSRSTKLTGYQNQYTEYLNLIFKKTAKRAAPTLRFLRKKLK